MARRYYIVVGDTTTAGGKVLSGHPFISIQSLAGDMRGKVFVGDDVLCGQCGPTKVAVGGAGFSDELGRYAAREGDQLACGHHLVSTEQRISWEEIEPTPGHGTRLADRHATTSVPAMRYDEALQFVGATGAALAHIAYVLHLQDGTTAIGTTDAEGKTRRIATSTPVSIVRAELEPPQQPHDCCGAIGMPASRVVLPLTGVTTTAYALGTSTHRVAVERQDRSLTAGEKAMLLPIFANAIDFASVRIHPHGYWLFFGFQDKDTAVTPNGELYMPGALFKPDYSKQDLGWQRLFVHEMVHVWQYQLGYSIKSVRAPRPRMSYAYTLAANKKLCDYNMEAQGNIIADYFLLACRGDSPALYEHQYRGKEVSVLLPQYEAALSDFLADPGLAGNLPKVVE